MTLVCSNEERGGVLFEGQDGWAWANRGTHEASARGLLTEPLGSNEKRLYRSDNHVKNFIDSCFSGRPTVAPIEAAHRSVTVAHLANIAVKLGRGLRWDPRSERILGDASASAMLQRPYRGSWTLS